MTEKMIKRFFEAYGYSVNVIMNDNEVIDVYNEYFKISLGIDNRLYMTYKETNGQLIEYDFKADEDWLYSMIISGWSITHDLINMIKI